MNVYTNCSKADVPPIICLEDGCPPNGEVTCSQLVEEVARSAGPDAGTDMCRVLAASLFQTPPAVLDLDDSVAHLCPHACRLCNLPEASAVPATAAAAEMVGQVGSDKAEAATASSTSHIRKSEKKRKSASEVAVVLAEGLKSTKKNVKKLKAGLQEGLNSAKKKLKT